MAAVAEAAAFRDETTEHRAYGRRLSNALPGVRRGGAGGDPATCTCAISPGRRGSLRLRQRLPVPCWAAPYLSRETAMCSVWGCPSATGATYGTNDGLQAILPVA